LLPVSGFGGGLDSVFEKKGEIVRVRGSVLLAAILCCSCGSAPSTEETVALLASSPLFKKEYKARIEFGEHCDGLAVAPGSPEAYMEKMYPEYLRLAEQGFIKITTAIDTHPNWWWQNPPAICVREMKKIAATSNEIASQQRTYYYWTSAATPKGNELGIPPKGGEIVLASKEVEQVTGIEKTEDELFEATYWWKWSPTKIGQAVPKLIEYQTKKSKTLSGTARLQNKDDGWTIVSVSDQS
jgi:hypothetical protein